MMRRMTNAPSIRPTVVLRDEKRVLPLDLLLLGGPGR